jgi:glutathionylspermidine synthase
MLLRNLPIAPNQTLASWGWHWLLGTDTLPYIHQQVVELTHAQAQAYLDAANELYPMYVAAAEHVISNKLYQDLAIPPSLIPSIEHSWAHDNHWHIYGRFDLAGGQDGLPIKLIEFNADTATCLPETALVQWASLKANGMDEHNQANNLYQSLVEQFATTKAQNPQMQPFMLFSGVEGAPEDDANLQILMEAAQEAGFKVAFEYIENVEFSEQEGVFRQNNETGQYEKYNFWYKLLPWEYIAWDEPELTQILEKQTLTGKTMVLNPAYTLLFQSKGILPILWQLYPDHPLLLASHTQRPIGQKCVQKVMLGREGANVQIINEYGRVLSETPGEYANQQVVYQAFAEFPVDALGRNYQAGVFFAGEACALGFRLGSDIIDNRSQFCGHIIRP